MSVEDRFDDMGLEGESEEDEPRAPAADSELTRAEFASAHREAIARERERVAQMDSAAIAEEIERARATLEELGGRREQQAERTEAIAVLLATLELRGVDAEVADLLVETREELVRALTLGAELQAVTTRVILHLRELRLLYDSHHVPQA